MFIQLGPDEGNSGAIIRWGKTLDNGIWIRRWRHRRLWFNFRKKKGYLSLGIIVFHLGN